MSVNRTTHHSHCKKTAEDDAETFELSPTRALIGDNNFEFETQNVSARQRTRQTKSNPSLFLAMCQTYGLSFLVAGFLKVINDLLNFVGPQVLK